MAQNKWKISEKELEDRICESPERMLWDRVKIVERQVKLRHGILDILAFDTGVLVIELKATKIREKDIEQVFRYMRDIRAILTHVCLDNCPVSPDAKTWTARSRYEALTFIDYNILHGWENYSDDYAIFGVGQSIHKATFIRPILIGTDIDRAVLRAAFAAGVKVYLWQYDEWDDVIEIAQAEGVHGDIDYLPHPKWATTISSLALDECQKLSFKRAVGSNFLKYATRN